MADLPVTQHDLVHRRGGATASSGAIPRIVYWFKLNCAAAFVPICLIGALSLMKLRRNGKRNPHLIDGSHHVRSPNLGNGQEQFGCVGGQHVPGLLLQAITIASLASYGCRSQFKPFGLFIDVVALTVGLQTNV